MTKKIIDLIVLENDQEKRIPFLQFSWYESPKKTNVKRLATPGVLSGLGWQYTYWSLSRNYLNGIIKVHDLFKTIVEDTDQQDYVTYENITARPFAYAMPEAYEKIKPVISKEKDNDTQVNTAAHICWEKGIFVSLSRKRTLNDMLGLNVHEHGHHMHYLLRPRQYVSCDATMIELMAIFTMVNCNLPVNYRPANYNPNTKTGETPHYRAEKLLDQLYRKQEYFYLNTAEQWDFLIDFHEHQKLQEYINQMF